MWMQHVAGLEVQTCAWKVVVEKREETTLEDVDLSGGVLMRVT